MIPDLLRIGKRITVLPVIHGSGDFALEVRRLMLDESFDCLAVPLPASFQRDVQQAIDHLPTPSIVVQREAASYATEWTPDSEDESNDDPEANVQSLTYVPIDPCQPVIAALRIARGEHIPCAFIDADTAEFEADYEMLPDPYAVKKVRIDRFAGAMLPSIPRPSSVQIEQRVVHMARRLRELQIDHKSILLVCSVLEWPWIHEAFIENTADDSEADDVAETEVYQLDPQTLAFMLGELPFITGLYERARSELEDDENLSIDGIKELLIASRTSYLEDFRGRSRKITPHGLATCLKFIRNLTLVERRFTPDLYTIVTAAKQVCGDGYALHVAETSREYPYHQDFGLEEAAMSIDRIRLPDGGIFDAANRLPGHPVLWRTCELQRRVERKDRERWQKQWNPMGQCSWPPEDEKIENFRSHVLDRAKQIMGADLAKTEKFTTSIKDGIDIRETLRNWHTGEIYVKELPPSQGDLDAAVMLFDSPADPRDYPWRSTWFAEHDNESTLAFTRPIFSRKWWDLGSRWQLTAQPCSYFHPSPFQIFGPIRDSISPKRLKNEFLPQPACTANVRTWRCFRRCLLEPVGEG